MAFTGADQTAIEQALASGQLMVKQGDREITYRSVADLRQQLGIIKADLAAQASAPASICTKASFRRG